MADNGVGLTDAEAKEVLEKYVLPIMEEILLAHITLDIYGGYVPKEYGWIGGKTYQARYSLTSRSDLYHEIDGNTIMVTSLAEPEDIWDGFNGEPGGFLQILEEGNMGAWTRVTGKKLPRPALSEAQKTVDKSKTIEKAVERGINEVLKKRR